VNENYYLLKDVAKVLGVKPYRVGYALATGLVPEPETRIANKRIFDDEDIRRLAAHFGVELRSKGGSGAVDGR
jgi:DNA-binding transcriptional MerR regulator